MSPLAIVVKYGQLSDFAVQLCLMIKKSPIKKRGVGLKYESKSTAAKQHPHVPLLLLWPLQDWVLVREAFEMRSLGPRLPSRATCNVLRIVYAKA